MMRALCGPLLLLLAACDAAAPGPNPNAIDGALLRPVLLDDRTHMESYLAALPEGVYRVYEVKGVGKFHVDNIDDLIKEWLRNGRVWEKHLVELFPKHVKPGSTVIDAGAHIGTHTVSLARLVGPHGRVYAFEPQRKIYRELVHNLRLNGASNVVALRYALGDAAGVVEMSQAVRGNEGGTPVGTGGDRAELRSIDSFGFRNVSFIKIDVEGFEDQVLEGARQTIAKHRPIVLVEIQGGHSYERASPAVRERVDATRARLAGMGYHVERVWVSDYIGIPR